jgi:DNA-directed RNA polymerase specialized sigma24 family protein
MTQENLNRINEYVTANHRRLQSICFKLYRGADDWKDLFQEFYLKIIETPQEKLNRYKLQPLCYFQILQIYRDRYKKCSPLRRLRYIDVDRVSIPITYEYTLDIEEYIDAEMNKAHGFADIMVFMESQEKTLRELKKETGINITALSRYRQAGQKKLQNLLACRI